MKTVLVTGGAGFIGSNFIIYFLNKHPDYTVVNLDKLTYAGNINNLSDIEKNSSYSFVHGDICDSNLVETIFKTFKIDYIVNFAAESHVDRSIESPEEFIRTNIVGTARLLNIAKKYWLDQGSHKKHKFLQVSTDEVYGSLGETGYFTENTPLDPHSPYSSSKASADMIVKAYFDTYKLPINITRCSNNYGPYQFPEKLIPLMINNALHKKPLPVYGDGLNIRDWLYVEDHCSAIDIVLHKAEPGSIYNIGGNNEYTNIQIINHILQIINEKIDKPVDSSLIRHIRDRKGHDRRYAIDSSKIQKDLGWRPETSFQEGIRKTVDWYLENMEWMENITSGEYRNYYKSMYDKEVI